MKELAELIKTMDLDFFGNGLHCINFEQMMNLYKKDEILLLDVRSKEELKYVSIPFAKNIPLNEIPDNLNELTKDKLIVVYCTSNIRSAIACVYLLLEGYNARVLKTRLNELVDMFKPGYIINNLVEKS